MKLPLKPKNKEKVESALKSCNGKASAHTFTFGNLLHQAAMGEHFLYEMGLTKAQRVGASLVVTSGEKLPSAYKYKVLVNRARMTRTSTGWTLVELKILEQWEGGGFSLMLSPEQDAIAIAKTREKYKILVS